MEDFGVWDVLAPPCGHAEIHKLPSCEICSRCKTVCPSTHDLSVVYADVCEEIRRVQEFASYEDNAYWKTLDKIATYIELH